MFYASILYMKSLYAVDSMLKLFVIYKPFLLYVQYGMTILPHF